MVNVNVSRQARHGEFVLIPYEGRTAVHVGVDVLVDVDGYSSFRPCNERPTLMSAGAAT
jgi:hypothetical protein